MSFPTPDTSDGESDAWRTEGGSLPSDVDPEMLGIVRQMTETFHVGGFRYTKLGDAIAQARRMAKLERELS